MRIGIIDAEIIGKNRHRFPNLASMKLSSYHKMQGDNVTLLLSYDEVDNYDVVYVSKVFIKTEIPCEPEDKSLKTEQTIIEFYQNNSFLHKPNIKFGGTGFYYEKAPKLPEEIEHCKPDYHLYDAIAAWVNQPAIYSKFDFDIFCKCRGMKPEGYKKYKRDIVGYLTEYGKKNAPWTYLEDFNQQTNNCFDDIFHILPFSLAKYGKYKEGDTSPCS